MVDDINSIKTLDELSDFICDPERSADVPMILLLGSSPMGSDATRYGTFIGYESLLLGDPGDYREGIDRDGDEYKQTLANAPRATRRGCRASGRARNLPWQ